MSHCVGVDNGTNAIELALQALGVGPGDEVITVSNTAAPTVVAIDAVGATPVLRRRRRRHYLMDIDQVGPRSPTGPGACCRSTSTASASTWPPLQRAGRRARPGSCWRTARRRTAPATTAGWPGPWATAAAFSFYPTKVLGAYGDGGATITADDRGRRRRCAGCATTAWRSATTSSRRPGHNSRLDEVQAEILRRKLAPARRLHRRPAGGRRPLRRGARRHRARAAATVAAGNEHVYYVYVVRHPRRDDIIEALRAYDIHAQHQLPVAGAHHDAASPTSATRRARLPVTEKLAGEIFSLPMYPSLPPDVQDKVIDALREVLASL